LIRKGLVIEKPVTAKAPVWREDVHGRRLMAVISDDGLAAIGMLLAGEAGRLSRAAAKKKGAVAADKAVAVSQTGCDGRDWARNWQRWSDCWNARRVRRTRKCRRRLRGKRIRSGEF
jgi:hypothetical protein